MKRGIRFGLIINDGRTDQLLEFWKIDGLLEKLQCSEPDGAFPVGWQIGCRNDDRLGQRLDRDHFAQEIESVSVRQLDVDEKQLDRQIKGSQPRFFDRASPNETALRQCGEDHSLYQRSADERVFEKEDDGAIHSYEDRSGAWEVITIGGVAMSSLSAKSTRKREKCGFARGIVLSGLWMVGCFHYAPRATFFT